MTVHQPDTGRYFEEFRPGDIFKHWPGRTITEADNTWFTLLTMNTHPVHFDQNYARGQAFGKPLVNSTLTLSIVVGMTVRETSQNAIANLGWEQIRLPHPVFAGDTIYAETEILAARPSQSRPDAGVVTVKSTGYNQENQVVISYQRSFLVKRRGYDQGRLPQFGVQA